MQDILKEVSVVDTWETIGWSQNARTSTILPNPGSLLRDDTWRSYNPINLPGDFMLDVDSFKEQLQPLKDSMDYFNNSSSLKE